MTCAFARPLLAGLILLAPLAADEASAPPKAVFTDSTPAPLGTTRRVAISQLVVSFQASVGKTIGTGGLGKDLAKYGLGGLLRHDKTTETGYLQMDLDPELTHRLANTLYSRLQAELAAAGFEVVPEAEVVGQEAYKALLKEAGYANSARFYNGDGDTLLVAPDSLPPYMPYAKELGEYFNSGEPKTYRPGWIKKIPFAGGSSTPGGPKFSLAGSVYGVPDLEVKLAKALKAHVLKAHLVVTIGDLDLKATHDYSNLLYTDKGATTITSGSAVAVLGLKAWQTRLAFRTPEGRGQSAAKQGKVVAAKDGDVVVTLDQPLRGLGDHLSVKSTKELVGEVVIAEPDLFATRALDLLDGAQKKLVDLVKR
ncbi:hypothetical protein [Geothrix sp. PMB-07]|uniref:hypothetical protein n=1 Tax=Geothrix sp. PMB-07 TaxID=3068640 RepID=UPI002740C8F9|nr:hypothetical protein [Geothrix sp. PMB-07]WLT33058.1 hypothetical protein Q9293_06945 [Geothrix sp. PMB-07]